MAKYGTIKYNAAKYGSYAVLRTSIQLKELFKIDNIINRVIHIIGPHRFRIKSGNGLYTYSQVIPIQGQVNKLRIRSSDGTYTICERKTLN
jgi:hypothetical protein